MTQDIEYTGTEKRKQGRTIADVEAAFDRKLQDHEDREQERIQNLIDTEQARVHALISQLKTEAFPDGTIKHGEYHQAKINSAKEEAEFWKAAKMELTKGGVSAVLWVAKTILVLAAVGFLYKIGLGGLAGGLVK